MPTCSKEACTSAGREGLSRPEGDMVSEAVGASIELGKK